MSNPNQKPADNKDQQKPDNKAPAKGETYTYVGAGDEPPRRINFMGLQTFIRFKETEVTDEKVLAKIQNHPCFRKGAVDEAEFIDADEAAAKEANDQRAIDTRKNAAFVKKHKPAED